QLPGGNGSRIVGAILHGGEKAVEAAAQSGGLIGQQIVQLADLFEIGFQIIEHGGIGAHLIHHELVDHALDTVDIGSSAHIVAAEKSCGIGCGVYTLTAVSLGIGIGNIVTDGAQSSLTDFQPRDADAENIVGHENL